MHRSVRTARSMDGRFLVSPEKDCLPINDPRSEIARMETAQARSTERIIHLIPLVLIFSAAALWFFSHPVPRGQIKAIREDDYENLNHLDAIDGNETEGGGIGVDKQGEEIEKEETERASSMDGIGPGEIISEKNDDGDEESEELTGQRSNEENEISKEEPEQIRRKMAMEIRRKK
ncbi:hypothetical protein AXF42_Ash003064 [Apostasia shenzhenica]|uniref:Uncharacterized protein n=1 Tax=Apostasia shenzhenica TaxID=1088818 RepID=A0A2I0A838_9ASPA|nr:hypothetical protein AXF42_Ash003064 [Apostasia shenzhenica]